MYSRTTDAFDATVQGILQRFASQMAILVANMKSFRSGETLSNQLKDTLAARETIAMARGVVMAQQGIDPDKAFRWLIASSERDRVPLRQLAERILRSR